MQDFYIQQRTSNVLNADQIQRWFLTVEMLAPANMVAGDDTTCDFILATQENDLLYRIPLVRHLTAKEAERIVEGYMRITTHDFNIETSNVYRADADFAHPFADEIEIEEGAKEILKDTYKRQAHNEWIKGMMEKGYRYGLRMSLEEKTHPAMRPWDDLPESYQKMPAITDRKLLDYYSKNINKFN
tara:strand:- start:154 stop:711 length:558 start_codon:yes stop_codon:yes gene_type:complete